jgi:hypothetical protein
MSVLTVLVVIGIIVYVVGQQLVGGALSGKRVVVLPAVLTVIGIVEVSGQGSHPDATDIVLLVVSAVVACRSGAGGRCAGDRGRDPVRTREGRHRVRRRLVLPPDRTRGLSDGVQLVEAVRQQRDADAAGGVHWPGSDLPCGDNLGYRGSHRA